MMGPSSSNLDRIVIPTTAEVPEYPTLGHPISENRSKKIWQALVTACGGRSRVSSSFSRWIERDRSVGEMSISGRALEVSFRAQKSLGSKHRTLSERCKVGTASAISVTFEVKPSSCASVATNEKGLSLGGTDGAEEFDAPLQKILPVRTTAFTSSSL